MCIFIVSYAACVWLNISIPFRTDIHPCNAYRHTPMHTYIDQYRSIDRFIDPSIYLSTPPSIYPCVSACTHKGSGIHTIVHWSAYPRACRECASAFRRRDTPLHHAAREGHAAVVAGLIALGADVHAKDSGRCVLPVVCFLTHTGVEGRLFVRVHACIFLCVCASMRAHMRAHACAQACAHTCARMRAHTSACTHACAHTQARTPPAYI